MRISEEKLGRILTYAMGQLLARMFFYDEHNRVYVSRMGADIVDHFDVPSGRGYKGRLVITDVAFEELQKNALGEAIIDVDAHWAL